LPISYISSNPHVATVSDGNTVNIHGAGVVRLSAYNPGNSNILGDTASVELTVSKARQSITFPAIPNAHPGDKTVLQATSSSGLPVSYISSNDQVAEVSGNTLIIHDAGDVDIVAYQNGDENYSTAGNTKQRLRITKYPQEIVFNLPAKVFGDRPFVLDGASSSGLPVSYESSDTAIAVISGDILTLKGVGKALITAYQTGDEYYDMVTVTKALHVNRDTSTIIFPEIPVKACGDADFTLEARSSSGLPIYYKIDSSDDSKNSYVDSDAVAAISGNRVTIKAMGETTITAFQDDQDNLYNTTKFSRKLFVNKAPQSITFPAIPEKTYGVAPFLAGAQTNISGLTVAYESTNPQVATVSNGRITVHGAGTTDIIAYQDGNSQYRSDWARQTLTVKPATQRIAFPEPDRKTFGNSPFTLQAVSSSGLPVTFSSSNPQVATVTAGVVTIAGAGETQITAVQGGNSGYAPAAIITCTLTVNKAAQTVTDLPATMTRDGGVTTFNLPESTDFGLPITYESDNREVATIWNNTVTVHNAGTTRITATQAGNKNYEPMTKICDLTITKATQTIDFPEIPLKITGDAPFSLHAVSSMGLPVYYTSSNPSIASISNNSVVTVHGAGQIEITASQDGNGRCLPAETKQTLSVNRASENITFPEIPVKAYGDASFNLGVRSSSGVSYVVSNQDVVTVSDSGDAVVKGVGTSLVTAYSAGEVIIRTLTVTKATQTLTFPVIPVKTYGDAAFVPGATGSSGSPVTYESSNPLVAEILNDMVTITGVGTAVITARQAGDDHYESAQLSRTLTVNAASQVITFPEISGKTYGDAPFSLHASSNVGQLFYVSSNPQTAIVSDEGEVTVTGAGTSVITVRGLNMDGTLDAVTRTLTVNKAFQTITFPEIPVKTYGIHPFNLQATSSSGLSVSYESSNPQVASIWNSTVTIHSAGTTRITASQAGNENYNPSDKVSRTLVVEKEPLYLLLDETSVRSSGDFVPVRAYVGFKDGDDESVLDELPVIRRDENSDSPWYILVGGSDDNYEYYISYDGRTGFDMPGKGSVRVYSTANRIGIVSDEAIRSVDLIDLTGRVLLHRLFDKSAVEIPVDNCPQGQYLLRVTLQSGRTEVRKTVRN
jgi:hypothetical protein